MSRGAPAAVLRTTHLVQLCLLIPALVGFASGETCPTEAVPAIAETRWLLIRNPRITEVHHEPTYVWIEERNVPETVIMTLVRGTRAIIAPAEIVAEYGPPPGGGKISPWQMATCRPEWSRMCASRRPAVIPIVHPATGDVLGSLRCADACPADQRGALFNQTLR